MFEMGEGGLVELADPARAFLVEHETPAPGSVVAPTLEGSRPLLVEVQALVAPSSSAIAAPDGERARPEPAGAAARRPRAAGGIGLGNHDVYANLAGGLTCDEPGMDLPLALALASSLRDRPVQVGTVAIGEVGLLGELRAVSGLERRLREAARLGFGRAIVPGGGRGERSGGGARTRDRARRDAPRRGGGGPARGSRGRPSLTVRRSATWHGACRDARLSRRPRSYCRERPPTRVSAAGKHDGTHPS